MDLIKNFPDGNSPEPQKDAEAPRGNEKRGYLIICILSVLLAILVTFIVTYVVLSTEYEEDLDQVKAEYESQLDSMGEFYTIAALYNSLPEDMRNIDLYKKLAYIDYYYRTHYTGKIDEEKLIYGMANGYIAGAQDQFGGYYSADEFKTIMDDSQGNTVGIGVYVTTDQNGESIRISYVMQGGPAYAAGLLPGDVIAYVDGKSVEKLGGYYGALDAVKGDPGTEVRIGFLRNGELMETTVVRDVVNVESVIYTKHQSQAGVGIIRIIEFNNKTDEQFVEAVKTAVLADGCTKLVFDLRGNTGGTLDSVVNMLDFMLPSGPIVTVRYADGTSSTYNSDSSGEEFESYGLDIKMAVLTNGYTASAAELFTCALKDYGMASVVGEKTFGKGCGQNVIPLTDGSGFIFTTFLYDPPTSENYNGVGIFPDVEAHLSEEASKKNIFDISHDEDDQLKAALEALK